MNKNSMHIRESLGEGERVNHMCFVIMFFLRITHWPFHRRTVWKPSSVGHLALLWQKEQCVGSLCWVLSILKFLESHPASAYFKKQFIIINMDSGVNELICLNELALGLSETWANSLPSSLGESRWHSNRIRLLCVHRKIYCLLISSYRIDS